MIRSISIILFSLIAAIVPPTMQAQAQTGFDLSKYGVEIDVDKRLMVVLATLEMARTRDGSGQDVNLIDTSLSPAGMQFRKQLAQDTSGIPEDLRARISAFVLTYKKNHPKATDSEMVTPFISMAYTLSPVPNLADPTFTGDLPGNMEDALDFAPLVRDFYRRSGISTKLDEYVKTYRSTADTGLRSSATDMIAELLNYLHTRPETVYVEKKVTETPDGKNKKTVVQNVQTVEHDRHFYIVPEMLVPNEDVNFLNVKDDYYLIVPPDKDLRHSEARRAFLQFVIDPLIMTNGKDISTMVATIKPLLEERRKIDPTISPDVFLTVGRSLVAAIDIRETEYSKLRIATQQARDKIALVKTDDEKRAVSADLEKYRQSLADETAVDLSYAYEHGLVLAFYFSDQLKGTEDSGFDLASSMREMILAFDASKETDRLAQNATARTRGLAAREERKKHPATQETVAENPITVRLLEIQKTIDSRNYVKALADLRDLSTEYPAEPRIYYDIGRVASLAAEKVTDPDEQARKLLDAKVAFTNVINTAKSNTDPALLSLTFVALGRIYEFFDDPKYAIELYDKAIKLTDVAGGAYRDAINAKQRLLQNP